MLPLRKNRGRRALRIALVLVWASFLGVQSSRAEQPSGRDPPRSLSVSVGVPMDGALRDGEALPQKGLGYVMIDETRKRRARFGIFELVTLIKRSALLVRRQHPGSVLGVADLSVYRGGRIEHHGSHQNGRDVDLLFYLTDAQGNQVVNTGFIPVDSNGYSTDPPLAYRFDAARNWALVAALIQSADAAVQWIFVSDHVKALLLAHAEGIGAHPRLRRIASQVLRQPGAKGHPDHFHVRILCPENDIPSCRDVGPRWAWVRKGPG
jgi:penicillin-insensitive murein endopeptidase